MPNLTSLTGLITRPLEENGRDFMIEVRALRGNDGAPPLAADFVEALGKVCPAPSSG